MTNYLLTLWAVHNNHQTRSRPKQELNFYYLKRKSAKKSARGELFFFTDEIEIRFSVSVLQRALCLLYSRGVVLVLYHFAVQSIITYSYILIRMIKYYCGPFYITSHDNYFSLFCNVILHGKVLSSASLKEQTALLRGSNLCFYVMRTVLVNDEL